MAAYNLIATTTVGSGGAASIDFTSIPQTYTDLLLKLSVRSTQANIANTITVRFNGSSSNFTARLIEGSGASASSFTDTQGNIGNAQGTSSTASVFSSLDVYIPNYAGSTNKSYSADGATENNAATAYQTMSAGLWSQTAAITQVGIYITNLAQYSSASLYGIKNS
jgi:hypothetical protein